jgi:hypothetical protein
LAFGCLFFGNTAAQGTALWVSGSANLTLSAFCDAQAAFQTNVDGIFCSNLAWLRGPLSLVNTQISASCKLDTAVASALDSTVFPITNASAPLVGCLCSGSSLVVYSETRLNENDAGLSALLTTTTFPDMGSPGDVNMSMVSSSSRMSPATTYGQVAWATSVECHPTQPCQVQLSFPQMAFVSTSFWAFGVSTAVAVAAAPTSAICFDLSLTSQGPVLSHTASSISGLNTLPLVDKGYEIVLQVFLPLHTILLTDPSCPLFCFVCSSLTRPCSSRTHLMWHFLYRPTASSFVLCQPALQTFPAQEME